MGRRFSRNVMVNQRLFSFIGGAEGAWSVVEIRAFRGAPLATVDRLQVRSGRVAAEHAVWSLSGVTSNMRYTTRTEQGALGSVQAGLGRTEATCAALIPIRKSGAWWDLPQDERRAIFEDQSRHTSIGLRYLPPVARRLHHCRDLETPEPFDFLTWFEFAPEHERAFDDLLAELRATREWDFVEREVEIRLRRQPAGSD
ncbi:chlorite dismutase family protein [Bradyrhizobium sp. HKCCYLR20261]|uniref:chlorite dismutase family protein n=1 Tax=Bradyrhizobium sp. HKCCYLR20261 TaxID=3420760 RepID=UPI003EBD6182